MINLALTDCFTSRTAIDINADLPAAGIKNQRNNFYDRLNRIRKISEQEYHRLLLNYDPPVKRHQNKSWQFAYRGIWYTDSHLLCRRSDAAPLIHALHQNLSRCSVAVSVGDEFDFAWSEVSDPISRAIEFKIRLAQKYPGCIFHTVAGNHDGCSEYLNRLQQAALRIPNIVVHEFVCRIGEYIFIHGDCVHWDNPTVEKVRNYRSKFNQGWTPNLAERLFDRITQKLGLHCQIPKHLLEYIIPRSLQASRIIRFITCIDPDILQGTKKICFGHTHKGFHGFVYRGIKFSNGGAHERGFKPAIHRFSFRSAYDPAVCKVY